MEASVSAKSGSEIFARAKAKWEAGDLANARRLMNLAAECDFLPALQTYAYFVENGIGGKPSSVKAMRWLKKAAANGDSAACMRVGRWYMAQGNDGQAKFWLWKARDRHAYLLLVKLHAKSRSVRATTTAKRLLSAIGKRPEELSAEERVEFDALEKEFSRRTPNAIWAPNNRGAAKNLKAQQRYFRQRDRRMLPDQGEARPSVLERLIQAVRRYF